MFPPMPRFRWASLPKISKKFLIIPILGIIFFASYSFVSAQGTPQVISPQQGADGQDYLLIPVSDLENYPSLNQSQSTRFATTSANLEGGQVLGLLDSLKDLVTGIGDIAGGIAGCVFNPVDCTLNGVKELFDFGMTAFQKFILNQIGGPATDCFIVNPKDPRPDHCAEIDQAIVDHQAGRPITLNPAQFGLLGITAAATTTALAMPLPLDSTTYLASINPFSQAYAAPGTDELEKSGIVLEIWKKVRDASYILLVVVTVIIGFLIMFRVPIGPRTAVTVQNSLPRIAVAMLLITFSFLMAGLMLDAARVGGDLLLSFLPSINLVGGFTGASAIFGVIIIFLIAIAGILAVFFALPGIGWVAAIIVLAAVLLIVLLLFIMFLIITYKLVTRLVIFLLMVMFAPLFFLFGALPRGEGAIIFWFKRTAAALIAIPATGFVISLALIIGSSGVGAFDLGLAVPETVAFGEGLAGGAVGLFSWAFAAPIIGLVLLSFAIKTPDIVDEMFGVKGFGTRAAGLGTILGAPGKAFKSAGETGRTVRGIQELREGGGRAIKSSGWSGGGTSGRIQKGIPTANLSPGFRNLMRSQGLTENVGGVEKTLGANVQGPAIKQPGAGATAARFISRRLGPILGGDKVPDKIKFTPTATRDKAVDKSAGQSPGTSSGTGVNEEDEL